MDDGAPDRRRFLQLLGIGGVGSAPARSTASVRSDGDDYRLQV